MTTHGPWIQGPDLWIEQLVDHEAESGIGTSTPPTQRPTADAGTASNSDYGNAADLNGGLHSTDANYPPLQAGWECDPGAGVWRFTVGFGFLGFVDPGPFVPAPTVPPPAVDYEWEGGSSRGAWLGGFEVWVTVLALSGSSEEWDFFEVTPQIRIASEGFLPIATIPSPSVSDHVKIVADGSGLLLSSGQWTQSAHCATRRQIYGDPPVDSVAADNPAGAGSMTYTMTQRIRVRPPRYRFLYATPDVQPPLRQFPRDDFLGGAPRQDRSSTSVQASTRQGFTGTYR